MLSDLDAQATTSFYWYLALLSCIRVFLFGYDTAVIGSVLDFVPYELSDLSDRLSRSRGFDRCRRGGARGRTLHRPLRSQVVAGARCGHLCGRRGTLPTFATDTSTLLFARTLIGLAVGADSAIATAYIAEFAPRGKRGALMIMQQWMITVGSSSPTLTAIVVFKVAPDSATGVDWRIILGAGALPALLALAPADADA